MRRQHVERAEPAGADGVRPAPLRRSVDRRNQRGAGPFGQRGEAQYFSRRTKAAARPGTLGPIMSDMNHLNEEQLVLYYYGEETAGVEDHLGECESCREGYHALQRVLN